MKGGGIRTPLHRRSARPTSKPVPRRRWPVGVMHHGMRILLLLATAVGIYLLFPVAPTSDSALVEPGAIARQDVIASVAFRVPKPQEELARDREQAASGVSVVFDEAPAAADSMAAAVARFFADAERALATTPTQPEKAVTEVLRSVRIPVTVGAVNVLVDSVQRRTLAAATTTSIQAVLPSGVVAAVPSGVEAVRVRRSNGQENLVATDSLATAEDLYRRAAVAVPYDLGADAAELQRHLLVRFFKPTLIPNPRATDAARNRARSAVDPYKADVLKGEKVVGAREQVGPREAERLRAYQAALEARREQDEGGFSPGRILGAILYNALLLSIVAALLRLSRPGLYDDDRAVVFLALLVVVVVGSASVVARLELPVELIPVPFAALIVAVLWGGRLALALALCLALLLGGQPPFSGLTVPFEAAVAGAAAAFGIRVAQRRLQTWLVIGIIAAAYILAALALGLLRARGVVEIGWTMGWGVVSAVACSLLAVGVLPLAEYFTRVTTNQTLMELADPKHPLLRRLALEAPGTYAHTISVANLAEAVCNAIGANSLLARVGVYYHDIGKVLKPHFYIENQPRGRNPHDKLKPSMSAAIVRSHVTEGLRLAEEARLPVAVKAFIAEHHGTQSISFFLDQARAADPDGRINAAEFAYAGPKPQTRETAVAMLADSVESAARALHDPSPQRIQELVDRIVSSKISSGQLDESPLTLGEITVAKHHLAKVLSGMYHHRIDYPEVAPNGAESGGAEVQGTTVGTANG